MGREARREQRNNWLYKPSLLHPAPKEKLIELKQKNADRDQIQPNR